MTRADPANAEYELLTESEAAEAQMNASKQHCHTFIPPDIVYYAPALRLSLSYSKNDILSSIRTHLKLNDIDIVRSVRVRVRSARVRSARVRSARVRSARVRSARVRSVSTKELELVINPRVTRLRTQPGTEVRGSGVKL